MMNVQRNDRGFGYLEFVSSSHGHVKTKVWVKEDLIEPGPNQDDELRPFPVQDAWIYCTEKGSLVLRPRQGGIVYYVRIFSGYRGNASITRCASPAGKCEVMSEGHEYHSGQGALGETAWALVNSDGPIEVYACRTGRRIDQNNIAFRLTPDGEKEELIEDVELCEIMEN